MLILLDMDGVLADFDAACFQRFPEFDWPEAAFRREKQYVTDFLPVEQQRKLRRAIDSGSWFRDLPVVDGALEGVDSLLSAGFELAVCTKPLAANSQCVGDKHNWLRDFFPMLADTVSFARDKSTVRGDMLIDDGIKDNWVGRASWIAVHYDYPHNAEKAGLRWKWGQDCDILDRWLKAVERWGHGGW